jgi:hypothetical protein
MIDWYTLGISFLATHELDAVQRHEWRVLPLTSWMPESIGFPVFTLAHIPIFYLTYTMHRNQKFRKGLSIFKLVHVGLHIVFMGHPAYEFNNPLSWFLIAGAGVCGALHLLDSK